MNTLYFTSKSLKQIQKLPCTIIDALEVWVSKVRFYGINEVCLVKGYRDHPLKGNRQGQRSVSLNKNWRVIYTEKLEILEIQEVTKHDYRTK